MPWDDIVVFNSAMVKKVAYHKTTFDASNLRTKDGIMELRLAWDGGGLA